MFEHHLRYALNNLVKILQLPINKEYLLAVILLKLFGARMLDTHQNYLFNTMIKRISNILWQLHLTFAHCIQNHRRMLLG